MMTPSAVAPSSSEALDENDVEFFKNYKKTKIENES